MSCSSTADWTLFPHVYHEEDTLPELVCVIEDYNISSATVRIKIERPDGTILSKDATILDGPQGQCKWGWVDTDWQAGYGQRATIELETAGGDIQTITRLLFNVAVKLS